MQAIAELQNSLQEPEDLRGFTDQELLDWIGMPHGATDAELLEIALGGSIQEET